MAMSLKTRVMLRIGAVADSEFWAALPKAHAKLFRIIDSHKQNDVRNFRRCYT